MMMMHIVRRGISASMVSSCRYTTAVSTSTTNTNIMRSSMIFSQRYMAGGPRNPEHTKRIKRKLQQKILSQNNAAAKKNNRKQQQTNIPQQHLIANVDARRQFLELVCDDNDDDDDAVNNNDDDISKMKPKKYSIPSNIKPYIPTIEHYITNTWIHQYEQQGVSTSKLRNDLAFRCKEIQGVELLYKKKLDGNILQSIVWDIVSTKEKEGSAFIGKGNDGRYSGNSIGLRVNSKGQMILYPKIVDEDDDDEKEEEEDDADNK